MTKKCVFKKFKTHFAQVCRANEKARVRKQATKSLLREQVVLEREALLMQGEAVLHEREKLLNAREQSVEQREKAQQTGQVFKPDAPHVLAAKAIATAMASTEQQRAMGAEIVSAVQRDPTDASTEGDESSESEHDNELHLWEEQYNGSRVNRHWSRQEDKTVLSFLDGRISCCDMCTALNGRSGSAIAARCNSELIWKQ